MEPVETHDMLWPIVQLTFCETLGRKKAERSGVVNAWMIRTSTRSKANPAHLPVPSHASVSASREAFTVRFVSVTREAFTVRFAVTSLDEFTVRFLHEPAGRGHLDASWMVKKC